MKDIVLTVSKHRIFGNIIAAFHVQSLSEYVLQVVGRASSLTIENEVVPDDVRQVIKILDELSEQHIIKTFSKGKTAKTFLNSLTEEDIKNNIRPFIDKRVCSALELAENTNLEFYRLSDGYRSINVQDRITLAPVMKCKPRFFFTITDSGDLLYTLKVSDGITDVSITNTNVAELASQPAVFVSGSVLYSLRDIPFAKFKPFVLKQRIVVESRLVDMYMEKAVMPNLGLYHVSAYGFDIIKHRSKFRACLDASDGIFGFGFSLSFVYCKRDGVEVRCDYADRHRPVSMIRKDGRYVLDVVMRDFDKEKRLVDVLVSDMGLVNMGRLFVTSEKASLIDLVQWVYSVRDMLDEYEIEVTISDDKNAFFSGAWNILSETNESIDWFDLRIVVEVGQYKIPFRRFLRNISTGDCKFPLPDGTIFIIPDEWFEQWSGVVPFVAEGNPDDERLLIAKTCAPLLPVFIVPAKQNEISSQDGVTGSIPFLTDCVKAQLRPYQEVGVRWLTALSNSGYGGILADDMGLGKTLQAITLLTNVYRGGADNVSEVFVRNETGLNPTLVVMPVSLIFNWQKELAKFAPQLSVYVYMGRNAVVGPSARLRLSQFHIVLTSYGMVRTSIDSLKTIDFEYVILDESHTIKNPSSKTYSAIQSLKAQKRINLSGTPVENNLLDLWAQMNIVNPNMLGSKAFFEQQYRRPIEQNADDAVLRRLRSVIRPYILRRTKEQVLRELPPISIQTITCAMSDAQREVYEREKSACRNALLGANVEAGRRRFMVLQALTKLRLIANHPSLSIDDYDGGSGKSDVVFGRIESLAKSGHKMLVFSSFVRDLDLLASRLRDAGIGYLVMTGITKDRNAVVSEFSNNQSIPVLLMSLKVGGVGLNLTCADYVLMLNPWWNPAAERQAYGRAHRMGQVSSVTVLRFVSQDTIEQKIDDMQARKLRLAADAIQTDQGQGNIDTLPSDNELEEMLGS